VFAGRGSPCTQAVNVNADRVPSCASDGAATALCSTIPFSARPLVSCTKAGRPAGGAPADRAFHQLALADVASRAAAADYSDLQRSVSMRRPAHPSCGGRHILSLNGQRPSELIYSDLAAAAQPSPARCGRAPARCLRAFRTSARGLRFRLWNGSHTLPAPRPLVKVPIPVGWPPTAPVQTVSPVHGRARSDRSPTKHRSRTRAYKEFYPSRRWRRHYTMAPCACTLAHAAISCDCAAE